MVTIAPGTLHRFAHVTLLGGDGQRTISRQPLATRRRRSLVDHAYAPARRRSYRSVAAGGLLRTQVPAGRRRHAMPTCLRGVRQLRAAGTPRRSR